MAASIHTIAAAFAIVSVALPWSAAGDFTLAPLLSPIFGGVCKGGVCGKGICKGPTSGGLGYECECDAGWRQARSQNDTLFKFLPCVIPNCSVDLTCGEGEAPAPAPEKNINTSILEPCHWAECGGGSCNKTGALTYTCICKEGYSNLLNSTSLPCVRECALGMDCKNLGFTLTNNSISPPPPSSSDGNKDKVCNKVGCGKGSCKASGSSVLGYECECDPGWKRTLLPSDTSFKFLPCVIPNCSINYSCGEEAPSPAPDKRANTSIFELCDWAECGGGSCTKTSALTYTCECRRGYLNLLNITTFPCFKECSIGMDCNLTNRSSGSTSTPSLSNNSNKGSSIIRGGFVWNAIAATSLAMCLFK